MIRVTSTLGHLQHHIEWKCEVMISSLLNHQMKKKDCTWIELKRKDYYHFISTSAKVLIVRLKFNKITKYIYFAPTAVGYCVVNCILAANVTCWSS